MSCTSYLARREACCEQDYSSALIAKAAERDGSAIPDSESIRLCCASTRKARASGVGPTFGYALSHHMTTQMVMITVPTVFKNDRP